MKQYIDKDALAAEIERKIEAHKETLKNCDSSISEMVLKGSMSAYQSFLHFLDTLEVKEVDLESNSFDATVCKIGSVYLKEMDRDAIAKALESYKNGDKVKVIIKAQKGE